MKPILSLVALSITLAMPIECMAKWTPLRLGINHNHQLFSDRDLIGLDLGIVSAGTNATEDHSKRSIGIQIAPIYTFVSESIGLSVAMLNVANDAKGIQIGLLNSADIHGAQFGVINGKIGPFGCAHAQSWTDMGLKVGLINGRCDGPSRGIDIGILNVEWQMTGMQIGVFNAADNLHGIQIGVLNFIRSRQGFGRFTPLMNVAF